MFAIRRSDIPTFQLKKLSIVGSDDTAPFVVPQQWKYFLQRYSSEYDSICVNQATKLDQQQIANDVGRTGYDLNPIQIQHLETVLLAMSVKWLVNVLMSMKLGLTSRRRLARKLVIARD